MDLVIWGYIFGGATIFGSIVGIFSVYNGRRTRKEICNLIKSEGESFKELSKELSSKISLQITKISDQTAKILDQGNKIMEQLVNASKEHRAMIDVLAKLKG